MAGVAIGPDVGGRGPVPPSGPLRHDWDDRGNLATYLATPSVQKLALRIAASVTDALGSRAWSLTGPFGSGKSAFAVYLTDVLARRRPVHPDARGVRRTAKLR